MVWQCYSSMPSRFTLNVSLTEHLSSFVEAQLASGRYSTASEVVRAALRLLEREASAATYAGQAGGVRDGPEPQTVPGSVTSTVPSLPRKAG